MNRYLRRQNVATHTLFDFLTMVYQSTAGKSTTNVFIFVLLLVPISCIAVVGYIKTNQELTMLSLQRRQEIAFLAASSLKGNFDTVRDIGISLATRPQLQKLVSEGKWEEEIQILASAPKDFPVIERIFLSDNAGTLMTDIPPLPGMRGQNFAQKDWYRGVTKNGKPYISEIYQRTAEPRYYVVSVAIPVQSGGRQIAILVLQIRMETLSAWSREVSLGNEGIISFVDPHRHAIGLPNRSVTADVPTIASERYVQKVLAGEAGIETVVRTAQQEEQILAFAPVPEYGWGVLVSEPTRTVFAQRNRELVFSAIIYGVSAVISILLAFFIVKFLQVVTEKGILERIEAELMKYKLALDNTSDHVIITTIDGIIIYANKAAESITGYSHQEIIGSKPSLWGMLMPKEFYEQLWQTIKGKRQVFTGQLTNRRKNGEKYEAEIHISPVVDSSGGLLFFVGIERDITREKEIDREKTEFVSLASHQLRTPLGIMKWYLEALQQDPYLLKAPEQFRNYYSVICENNERVLGVVRDLLSVSRIDQRRVKNNPTVTNVTEVVMAAVEHLQVVARKKTISLQGTVQKKPITSLSIDVLRFREAVENIICNALEYTPACGTVTVSVSQQGNVIFIRIQDTGIGIPEADQKKLFSKFFRSTAAVQCNPEGSGLGLYVAKSYVEAWGGTLTVESEEGKGSIFTICLPISQKKGATDEKNTHS